MKQVQYCRKCGKELEDKEDFCQECGAAVHESSIQYKKQSGGSWGAGKVIAVLFGGLLLLVGVPLTFAGTAVMGVTRSLDDGTGYIGIRGVDFDTGTQALVFKEMHMKDMLIDEIDGPMVHYWAPEPGDFVKLKFTAESNTGGEVFIGVIEESKAMEYLGDAEYDYISEFRMDKPHDRTPEITYRRHDGDTLNATLLDLDIWTAYANGEEATLDWAPEDGSYWVVIMNADASAPVDVETGLGVKVPFLSFIGQGLMLGGLVCLGLGGLVMYFGVVGRKD
ncbi:zinc ribbon domain-containing protein [Candidatus Bathyarchaeota archaeon]|nr:zinc ribbon domain-containing protein [Candidatus Bathyarchaeota archaeon]